MSYFFGFAVLFCNGVVLTYHHFHLNNFDLPLVFPDYIESANKRIGILHWDTSCR